jgi:hypothetical protein
MNGPSRRTQADWRCHLGYCHDSKRGAISETRKLAAILVADIVGYNRLARTDGERAGACRGLAPISSTRPSPAITAHYAEKAEEEA